MDKILLLHYLTLQSKTEYRKVGVYKFRAPVRQGKYFFFFRRRLFVGHQQGTCFISHFCTYSFKVFHRFQNLCLK